VKCRCAVCRDQGLDRDLDLMRAKKKGVDI
jgi:hypothetical protein